MRLLLLVLMLMLASIMGCQGLNSWDDINGTLNCPLWGYVDGVGADCDDCHE